jgi:hypothetical protein
MWWRHVLRSLLPISRIIRRNFGPCCAARTAKSLANLRLYGIPETLFGSDK